MDYIDADVIDVIGLPGLREPINCLSHLGGAAIFAVLTVILVRRGRGHIGRTLSLAVMGCSAVLLLFLSGVYHMQDVGSGRELMKRLDIAAVFLLIAGTFTPIHSILFTGFARWGVLALVWTTAVAGITLRLVFFAHFSSEAGTGLFLILGWAGVGAAFVLARRYGFSFICPLVAGGIAYSLGAVVLELKRPPLIPGVIGAHELWHGAVLAGISFHWQFVSQFATGTVSGCGEPIVNGGLSNPPLELNGHECDVPRNDKHTKNFAICSPKPLRGSTVGP